MRVFHYLTETFAINMINLDMKYRQDVSYFKHLSLEMEEVSLAQEVSLPERTSPEAVRAVWGAFFGFFVDMYDIYLPVVVLPAAIIYFEPKHLSIAVSTTIYYLVFSVTLIGRPIGAFIFGHYGDRLGRKRTAIIAVGGFGATTLLMAILPGYQQWGLGAVIVLTALRLVDGIFLGGEYTAASPLAMEYSPKLKRGLYGGAIMSGFPIAYVLISLLTALTFKFAPLGGVHSAFVQWGWRIPFLLGTVISILFILYYRSQVPESELWQKSEKSKSPLSNLFSGDNFKHLVQVFILMSGVWFVFNSVVDVLPGVLTDVLKISSVTVTNGLLVVNVVLAIGYVLAGVLSQRIGRRTLFVIFGLLSAIPAPIVYYLLVAHSVANHAVGFLLAGILEVITISMWGIVTVYINERFRTAVRASGFGIGYSLAVVIPSFFSFYLLWLAHLMPYKYTQLVVLILGGVLILIGALMGPETRDVDFRANG